MQRGDRAPDFELPDETGHSRRLSEMLRAGPVVLFFHPRAMTSGCTAEACHFRDLRTEFEKVGVQRMGISVDPVSKQKQFSAKHNFEYPLLSDQSDRGCSGAGGRWLQWGGGPGGRHVANARGNADAQPESAVRLSGRTSGRCGGGWVFLPELGAGQRSDECQRVGHLHR